jgi:hypothetical protein
MAKFKKGQSGNPKGCPKGAHHQGAPLSITVQTAKSACPDLIKRLIQIGKGDDMEQVVNNEGETIRVPAPVREQIKAIVETCKIAGILKDDKSTPEQSVIHAAVAFKILQQLELNANRSPLQIQTVPN